MSENNEVMLMLGRIQGSLDAVQKSQDDHSQLLHSMDDRLSYVERKTAIHGVIGGGVMAMVITACVELIKARLEVGG